MTRSPIFVQAWNAKGANTKGANTKGANTKRRRRTRPGECERLYVQSVGSFRKGAAQNPYIPYRRLHRGAFLNDYCWR
jgi:hypothetical protein